MNQMQSQQSYYQGQPQMNPNMQQPTPPRKRINMVAMIGLGLILLSICLFVVSPQISIYAWFFGMVFSVAGLFFKPRWMAVIGTVLSLIPILFFLLLVLVINNPKPPTEEDLQRSRELRGEVVDDSLLLSPIEVDELVPNDSTY